MPVALNVPESAWAAVDTQATDFLAAKTAPGLVYAVIRDGHVQHAGGVGVASDGGAAPGARTAFRIASMTKSFTAAAVLILRDSWLLRLDDPVSAYLPQLEAMRLPQPDWREPTIRDLLTMSGGWPTDDPWADREESMSAADYDALLAGGFSFNFAPGTGFEYSNLGYTMLGRIITNVSGVQYQQYVTDEILRPLGMSSTGFTPNDINGAHIADGHYFRNGEWQVEPIAATGEFAPLGGMFSTCEDLATWVGLMTAAFHVHNQASTHSPLSWSSLREMQQGQRVMAPSVALATAGQPLWLSSAAYGFGLMVSEDPLRGTIVGHSGGYPGYGTHMCWHPASGIGVIALSNGRYGGAFRVATSMLRTVLDAAQAPSRLVQVTDTTHQIRAVVDAVLDDWDDQALDGIIATNFDADIPRQHRRADIDTAIASVGALAPTTPMASGQDQPTSAAQSHLVWWRAAAHGRLRLEIRLTPQLPQRLQTLNVRAVPAPVDSLTAAARDIVAAFNCPPGQMPVWPVDLALAPAVNPASVLDLAVAARAMERSSPFVCAPHPCAATDGHNATFELRRGRVVWELTLAMDVQTGAITACALAQRPLTSDANAVIVSNDSAK